MSALLRLAGALALCGVSAFPAFGRVIRVPEDYETVLAAADRAVAGDSILVGPGTWTASDTRTIVFLGLPATWTSNAFLRGGVTLIGAGGADETVLAGDAPSSPSATVLIADQPAGPVRIEGLTITGPVTAVTVGLSSLLTLDACQLVASGVGLLIATTPIVVEDCLFQGHQGLPSLYGSAIDMDDGELTILRTEFVGNTNRPCIGKRTSYDFQTALIRDCVFHDNAASGMHLISGGQNTLSITVENNLFLRNGAGASNGGGMAAVRCDGVIRFNVFARDSVAIPGDGGAIQLMLTSVDVYDNTIYGCHATGGLAGGASAAMSVLTAEPFEFRNNIVAACTGARALRNAGTFIPQDGCNYYWANEIFDLASWPPAATDVFGDPELCDPLMEDFELMASSPCAAENNPLCGQIGALGIGCGTVAVSPESWGRIKADFRR